MSSRIGRAVPYDDLRVQGLWVRFPMSLPDVVGIPVGVQVRRVAVHTWPFVVFVETGWGKAAGFDHRCHVDRGGSVSSQYDAVFVDVLRGLS